MTTLPPEVEMYSVCTRLLSVISLHESLAVAKQIAKAHAHAGEGDVFFVCSPQGMVVAGYGYKVLVSAN